MDSLTHTLIGGSLVGVATLDPNIDAVSTGFVVAIVGASQIPDIDTVLKFKDNATYITHHRGITHSLPFTFLIWPILLTFISTSFLGLPVFPTYLWIQLAVFLHVFVDIFNSYGTQALRPINNKWIQIGWINTIDLFIIAMFMVYFMLWYFGYPPAPMFFILYTIFTLYYLLRFFTQRWLNKKVIQHLSHEKVTQVYVMPTLNVLEWRIVVKVERGFYVGRSYKGSIALYDFFKNDPPIDKHIKEIFENDKNYRAFTFFSPIYRYDITEKSDQLLEVRFIDLRYLKNGHYPFVCIMLVDIKARRVKHSYTGWVFTESRLQEILIKT